jgi:endonuclease/exonuclease/phosphatase family metal-dependent hydrolase
MEEKVNKKKRFTLNRVMLVLNALAILFLLLSYLPSNFPPSSLGYITLLGLGYPILLMINVAFILFWMFRIARFMLLSAIAIVIGFSQLTDFFRFAIGEDASEVTDGRIEVMTYNVHLFGLYDGEEAEAKRDKIFDVLNGESPDILCFQEFFHSDKKDYFVTKDSIVKFLPTKYYHARYTHATGRRSYFGVALFSKYPIVNRGYIPFESDVNNFCIYADLKIGDDTVRVFNAHLQSIRFKPEDYAFVDDNKNEEQLKTGVTRIAERLKIAFEKRQSQVESVAAGVASSPYPVILCGDFNDPPVSYTYGVLSDILIDSFKEKGSGIGNTYNGAFPSFRIDYVMHSKELEALDYRTVKADLSDHLPVVVGFRFKPDSLQLN